MEIYCVKEVEQNPLPKSQTKPFYTGTKEAPSVSYALPEFPENFVRNKNFMTYCCILVIIDFFSYLFIFYFYFFFFYFILFCFILFHFYSFFLFIQFIY